MFARAWSLLSSNWIIIVPGFIIAIAEGVLQFVLKPVLYSGAMGLLLAGLILGAVGIIASVLNLAFTTGMAQAAWERGTATIADGMRAFQDDAANLLVAIVLMIVLGIVATVTSFLLFIPLLAYYFFFIYTYASAVVGRKPGVAALQESVAIALKAPVPTLIIMAVFVGLGIVAGIISIALAAIPVVGPIVSSVLIQALAAYIALVTVGQYISLRSAVPAA